MTTTNGNLLEVKNLRTYFDTEDGIVKAVDDISFQLKRGETLGIVGESGSGKSVTNLSIIRLVPDPPGKIMSGEVIFNGSDLLLLSNDAIRKIRGRRIAMIFQDPMTSLNPYMKISRQLMEMTQLHLGHSKAQAHDHAIRMLETVGIPDARARADSYPHEFSGGMRQRVMIAMALSCEPELLIADEPTTALDVTIQAQILELIKNLKQETGTSVILITHDLGVVAGMTDDIIVMYAGTVFDKLVGGSAVRRVVKAVDGVSLDIYPGETLGLVGESGCGKSTLGRAILRLTEPTSGHVLYHGQDLAHLSEAEMREQRKHLQMI